MGELTRLLTPSEVGELLGIHGKTVERMARRGELPGRRVGRYWRFAEKNIAAWIDKPITSSLACGVPAVSAGPISIQRGGHAGT